MINQFHSFALSTTIHHNFSTILAMSEAQQAEKLKAKGDKLFTQKDCANTAAKYTEAIGLDEDNTILYLNRAACRLNLKMCATVPSFSIHCAYLMYSQDSWMHVRMQNRRVAQVFVACKSLSAIPGVNIGCGTLCWLLTMSLLDRSTRQCR